MLYTILVSMCLTILYLSPMFIILYFSPMFIILACFMDPSCDPDTACQAQPFILLSNECTSFIIPCTCIKTTYLQETFSPPKTEAARIKNYHHSREIRSVDCQHRVRLKAKRGGKIGKTTTKGNHREVLL